MRSFQRVETMAIAALSAFLSLPAITAVHAQPVTAYPWSASIFLGGGGIWTSNSDTSYDVASIVAGGDMVLPLDRGFNLQLGGALRADYYEVSPFGFIYDLTGGQAAAIAFWRDEEIGVLGAEAGLFTETEFGGKFVKLGAVAQLFASPDWTLAAFGGGLVPHEPRFNDFSYYAGGHVTHYAANDLAVAAHATFQDINYTFGDYQSLRAGGSVRWLTPLRGVELSAAGYYHHCENNEVRTSNVADGVEVLATLTIHLGGATGSLAAMDRSGPLDTRTWTCDVIPVL